MTDTTDEKLSELRSNARNVFWKETWASFQKLMDEAPSVYSKQSDDARYFRSEREMINKHVEPVYWGIIVGTFLFATFRVSGSKWFARIRGSGVVKPRQATQPAVQPQSQQQQQRWKTYLEKETDKKKEWIDDSIQLPIDLLVSLLCAGSSIVWLSQPAQMRKDFADAPLQPGKSLIHKCMCPELVRAYERQPATVFFGVEDDTLAVFEIFAKNCRIRSEFERQRALAGDNKSNVVPYPGLRGFFLKDT